MRGGKNVWRVAIGVERVFDDVVAGGAHRMNKELAGEGGQIEARANFAAVDDERSFRARRNPRSRLRARCPSRAEQPAPKAHLSRAVARPVICVTSRV